jgi:hypothetical protein
MITYLMFKSAGATASFRVMNLMRIGLKRTRFHNLALVTIAEDMTPSALHDFAHHVAPALASLDRLAGQAEPRNPTGLETNVRTRLDGRSPLLDSLDLHVAIKTCELLGAVDLFGRTANLKKMSDEQWRLAGARGFEIADGGEASVRDFLDKLQATFPYKRSGREGPQPCSAGCTRCSNSARKIPPGIPSATWSAATSGTDCRWAPRT